MLTGAARLKAFAKSPQHAWLGALTLGLGLATATPLFAILGAAAYGLGWVFLPDSKLFQNWVEKKRHLQRGETDQAARESTAEKRAKLLSTLSPAQRDRYEDLALQADRIAQGFRDHAIADQPDRLGEKLNQIDALTLTYLRLLHTEQSLGEHLEGEREESLENRIEALRVEITGYEIEVADLEAAGKFSLLDTRRRLLTSHRERLDMLEKRQVKLAESEANLELIRSEQSRLIGLIKLLGTELKTSQDAGSLSDHIDANTAKLHQTNHWLEGMEETTVSFSATDWESA